MRPGAALLREDDRAEPDAGDAADRPLHGQRAGPGDSLQAWAIPQLYTRADIELLAVVDEAHETVSGPATQWQVVVSTPQPL